MERTGNHDATVTSFRHHHKQQQQQGMIFNEMWAAVVLKITSVWTVENSIIQHYFLCRAWTVTLYFQVTDLTCSVSLEPVPYRNVRQRYIVEELWKYITSLSRRNVVCTSVFFETTCCAAKEHNSRNLLVPTVWTHMVALTMSMILMHRMILWSGAVSGREPILNVDSRRKCAPSSFWLHWRCWRWSLPGLIHAADSNVGVIRSPIIVDIVIIAIITTPRRRRRRSRSRTWQVRTTTKWRWTRTVVKVWHITRTTCERWLNHPTPAPR